jgi:Transcription termination and cleavage factor C-terminal
MLRQVMALTPEAIANLAPEQQAEIERVKQYARSHNLI